MRALAETDRAPLVGAIEERAVVAPPASFGYASLFIDDVDDACNRTVQCATSVLRGGLHLTPEGL